LGRGQPLHPSEDKDAALTRLLEVFIEEVVLGVWRGVLINRLVAVSQSQVRFSRQDDAMLFVIIGHDGPEGAKLRPQIRPAHLENLIVVDMESEAAALAFAKSDPYTTSGVFERVEVKPFRQVFPE
jgi:uncharacterized protein YciI